MIVKWNLALVLCSLFCEHEFSYHKMNDLNLRSNDLTEIGLQLDDDNVALNFIQPKAIVAVAAHQSSSDTVWFIAVTKTNCVAVK